MARDILSDVRATTVVERLLEESWAARSRLAPRRELCSEAVAGAGFLAAAVACLALGLAGRHIDVALCALLVAVYAVVARTARFPVGAGFVVPSYLVLVPMLLLVPVAVVPLLVCAGLSLGSFGRWVLRRGRVQDIFMAIPDAWHALGPASVLLLAGDVHGPARVAVYGLAFAAGCLVDLLCSAVREWLVSGLAPRLQLQVMVSAWLLDACFAPLGFAIAVLARAHLLGLLLLAPLGVLLVLVNRDRTARIAQAQRRLDVVARERARLQSAVQRLGDAFAARLDLGALADVLLRSSVEALDATAGRLAVGDILLGPARGGVAPGTEDLLARAVQAARASGVATEIHHDAGWAFAVPIAVPDGDLGALAVVRCDRPFGEDERDLLVGLVRRAETAAADIVAHRVAREQARTDPLTRLGNRRGLTETLEAAIAGARGDAPRVLALFDLDGFKAYNDAYGHLAGDELLTRLGRRLQLAVAPHGSAYRLGGDEFCVLLDGRGDVDGRLARVTAALAERGEEIDVGASCGWIRLPAEASTAAEALSLADTRMYEDKHSRRVAR